MLSKKENIICTEFNLKVCLEWNENKREKKKKKKKRGSVWHLLLPLSKYRQISPPSFLWDHNHYIVQSFAFNIVFTFCKLI